LREETVKQWESVDDVLDFAIEREQEAVRFYTDLAAKMDKPATKEIFQGFAREEAGHKAKLLGIKESGHLEPSTQKVLDLKIGDYLVEVDPTTDELDYQNALILAMKREKAAFKLYTNLAEATDDADLKGTMLALAQEEAKHKLRFEVEYDDQVLAEN
jgi:rubrerythrin